SASMAASSPTRWGNPPAPKSRSICAMLYRPRSSPIRKRLPPSRSSCRSGFDPMLEAELYARLIADPTLAGLIGDAVYPGEAPADAPSKYVIFSRMDTMAQDTLDDAIGDDRVMLSLVSYAPNYLDALTIAAAIRPVLDGWHEPAPATVLNMTYAGEHD